MLTIFYLPLFVNYTHYCPIRRCLRNLSSWVESRELWCSEAIKVRAEFTQNKNSTNATGIRLLREGAARLAEQTHPDNYIAAYMPGGSLFMRNPAIPLEALYPDGIPEGKSRRRLSVDMSNIPDDQEWADKTLVDSCTKSYWIDK